MKGYDYMNKDVIYCPVCGRPDHLTLESKVEIDNKMLYEYSCRDCNTNFTVKLEAKEA